MVFEKIRIAPIKSKVKTPTWEIVKGGSIVRFRGSGRRFCFGRGSDISSMFWTSVVQVEQMNNNVDLTRLKTLPTVRVGHFSSKAPTEKSKGTVL